MWLCFYRPVSVYRGSANTLFGLTGMDDGYAGLERHTLSWCYKCRISGLNTHRAVPPRLGAAREKFLNHCADIASALETVLAEPAPSRLADRYCDDRALSPDIRVGRAHVSGECPARSLARGGICTS